MIASAVVWGLWVGIGQVGAGATPALMIRCSLVRHQSLITPAQQAAAAHRGTVFDVAGHGAIIARLPQAREVVMAGVGHMPPITHPREVLAALAD